MFEWFQWNDMPKCSPSRRHASGSERTGSNVSQATGIETSGCIKPARTCWLAIPCEGYVTCRHGKHHGDEMRQAKQQRVKKGQRISVQLLRERIQLLKQLPPEQVAAYVNGELD